MMGLTSLRTGLPLKKPLRVVTTTQALFDLLGGRLCDKSHEHSKVEGPDTAHYAYYPDGLVDVVWNAVFSMVPAVVFVDVAEQVELETEVVVNGPYLQEEIDKTGLRLKTGAEVSASRGSDREHWLEAMRRELDAMAELDVFTVVPEAGLTKIKPKDIMPAKCVMGIKPYGLKKVRLVACGNYTQKYQGVVSTHAADAASVRMILAYAESKGWKISSMDVATAFLRASFPEDGHEYYIRVPGILVKFGLVPAGMVWRLRRPLYGLREAPRLWGHTRDKELKNIVTKSGFILKQSSADHSLWSVMAEGGCDRIACHLCG